MIDYENDPLGAALARELEKELSDDSETDSEDEDDHDSAIAFEPDTQDCGPRPMKDEVLEPQKVEVNKNDTHEIFEGSIWYSLPVNPHKVTPKHKAMSAEGQERAANQLKAKIEAIDRMYPAKQEEKEVAANATNIASIEVEFKSPKVEANIIGPTTPEPVKSKRRARSESTPKSAKRTKMTPEQKEQSRKKAAQRTKDKKDKLQNLPEWVMETMRHLNLTGSGFETSLSTAVRHSRDFIARHGGRDKDTVIDDLLHKEKAWKTSNREHLKGVLDVLNYYAVIPMGGVEVPTASLDVSTPVNVVKVQDTDEEVGIKVEDDC